MPNHFSIKRGGFSSHFSNLWLLIAAFLLAFPMASLAEETAKAPVKAEETPAAAASAPCQGLKPFNNLDELLYQFYINLESDCLFEMTPTELEKIWGIKILSRERAIPKPGEYLKLREGIEFCGKPYRSAEDAFYVEASKDATGKHIIGHFSINITKAYYEQTGRLFFPSKPPEALPPPVAEGNMITGYYLTWFNTDKTRMISCRYNSQHGSAGIISITIQHTVNPERFTEGAK